MPPPSYCSKISTGSTGDHEPEIEGIDNSRTELSNYTEAATDDECDFDNKYEGVGIVKTLLGPSLEDAVLRTLEFGKSLIQKTDENEPKKMLRQSKKEALENQRKQSCEYLMREGNRRDCKMCPDRRAMRKRIVFTAEMDKDSFLCSKTNNSMKKLTNVSKIRSLDSDLKTVSPSPEKIKRQLEALIQIHKDDPVDNVLNWNYMSKTPKLPLEMTVMPSFCYKNETDLNCSSSCDMQSQCSRRNNDGEQSSTSRLRAAVKKRLGAPSKICQAPEFLSNALGPTLDVSIIDNLKMMRDIFKCDSAKGEVMPCSQEMPRQMATSSQMKSDFQVRLQKSEQEMNCRIQDLRKKIDELERKEECLIKQIDEEERIRDARRRLYQDDETSKPCSMKICLEELVDPKRKNYAQAPFSDAVLDAKYECLQERIANEEEKLTRMKEQYENYKRELCEARNKKEALKRNKSLLDAWDVIASRVCHTRLPSFSKAYSLERRIFQPNETSGSLHCCLPLPLNQDSHRTCSGARRSRSKSRCRSRSKHRNQCGQCHSNVEFSWNPTPCGCSRHGSPSPPVCRKKHEDIPFPLQRDITCGLHQSLKTCSCTTNRKKEGAMNISSEEELLRKLCAHKETKPPQPHCFSSSLDTSAEVLLRKPPCGNNAVRSKSDTTLRNKCAKIVKVMWAVTRINIFQDNCRTYEVMDATSTPPPCTPAKTEGIFVVKSAQKKCPHSPSRRNCHANMLGP